MQDHHPSETRPAVGQSRRTVVRTGIAAFVPAVAGCSGGSDEDTPTPDPDAGRDSYGIHLFSEADSTYGVELKVTFPWEDGTAFEESVEIEPGDERTWHGVITEEREHNVVAKVEGGEGRLKSSNVWITPGEEDSPTDANVQVKVQTLDTETGPHPAVSVYFKSRQEDQ